MSAPVTANRSLSELLAEHERTNGKVKKGGEAGTPPLPDNQPRTLMRAMVADEFTHDGSCTVCHHRGMYFQHGGITYEPIVKELLRARIAAFAEQQLIATPDGPIPYAVNKRRVDDMLDVLAALCQAEVETMPAWLDNNRPDPRSVIAFQNGLMDVRRFLREGPHPLLPPTPHWFSTNVLPFKLDWKAPEPAAWWNFLAQLWPDDPHSIDLLAEWFGYTMTPDTSLQKILGLIGPTRSGKGTIARVQTNLIGTANVCGPTLGGLASHFGLWALINKQLAILSDVRMSSRADQAAVVELLLMISGEDGVTIDRKNQEPITVTLPTRLMVISNELPRLADASGALADRFIVLMLKESFLGREDTDLTAKLTAELPGIALWALNGLKRLMQAKRFTVPESNKAAVEELQDLTSPMKAFIRERRVVEPGKDATVATLYGARVAWCKEQGREHPGTQQSFGRDLRAAAPGIGVKQKRDEGDRVRVYEGIGVA